MAAKLVDCVWSPQEGPQHALVTCPYPEIFFGGARGGGKTDGVLGKWGQKEARYGSDFNAIMFRRTTVSSEDAIERAKEIYIPLGATFVDKAGGLFRMPNGGRVSFRYLESEDVAQEYQGRNVTDVWIEEVGQYPFSGPIDKLWGVIRNTKGVPVQMILTGNPGGVGQHWIAERYGLIPFPEKPLVRQRKLPNGKIHEFAVIPSRIEDNKILMEADPGYIDRLYMVGGEALVRAWLEGDWTAIEGAFFDGWSSKNILQPFAIPDYWYKFRSFDWGYAAPFSVGWHTIASEDYNTPDGTFIPKGAMIRYREWYGASGPNKGIRMEAEDISQGIFDREEFDEITGFGPADPSIFASDRGPSINERMSKSGITVCKKTGRTKKGIGWIRADNKRVGTKGMMGGWDQMRQRISSKKKVGDEFIDKHPMYYVFKTCTDFIRTVPVLQHDEKRPEDLNTDSEDHVGDEARYACMSRPITKEIPLEEADNTWAAPTAAQVEKRHLQGLKDRDSV